MRPILLVLLLLCGCSTLELPKPTSAQAAVADIGTTAYALSHGATELNPLGFVGTTALKGYYFIHRESLSKEERTRLDRITASVWGGAAVNNILQIMLTPIALPITIGIGIIAGVMIYY